MGKDLRRPLQGVVVGVLEGNDSGGVSALRNRGLVKKRLDPRQGAIAVDLNLWLDLRHLIERTNGDFKPLRVLVGKRRTAITAKTATDMGG